MVDVFPGSGELVKGEVPKGTMVLVGPAGVGKSVFCRQFLYSGLIVGEAAVLVATGQSYESVVEFMKALGFDVELYIDNKMLIVVDAYSWRVGIKRAGRYFVDSLTDLSDLSITIEKASQGLRGFRFVLDSVTDLVLCSSAEAVVRFLQALTARIKASDGRVIFTVTAGAHGDRFMAVLRSLSDGVLEMAYDESEGRLKRLFRVFFLEGTREDTSWVPFEVSERGITFTREAHRWCALCQQLIMGESVVETINGEEFHFHSKQCAETFKENAEVLLPLRDPVCGMRVPGIEGKHTADYEGKTYHFCSPSCKTVFTRNPERYARH